MFLEKPIPINNSAAKKISEGKIWIFSNEISVTKPFPAPGSWCHFQNRGEIVASGYFNPHSLIAGRVVEPWKISDIPAALAKRLEQSFEKRITLIRNESCRLLFSESDFLPGLIIDYFTGIAVLQTNTAGIDAILPTLESLIPAVFKKVFKKDLEGLVVRADSSFRKLEGIPIFNKIVFGDENKIRNGIFENNGVFYAADFLSGQKTGFFLDQAENRDFLAKLVAGKPGQKILDLFCYSGGWGLKALKSGDCHVTFVDESKESLNLVKMGIELNKFPEGKASIVCSEAFKFLENYSGTFDIIIADPPAFAKSKKDFPTALKGYEKLNRLTWRRLKQNGTLITSSCSFHVSDQDFRGAVERAVAKERGIAHLTFRGSQASDHPILLSMPETSYLKCLALKKLN